MRQELIHMATAVDFMFLNVGMPFSSELLATDAMGQSDLLFFFCHSFMRPQEGVQVGGLLRSPICRGEAAVGDLLSLASLCQEVPQRRRVALALLNAYKWELKE